ncbi:MAG TPA: EF-hand domain-containing protein [Hyphomicrobiales bacterium]|nr:EF-hand domain-containing protein [Hyphomicrobiales bacterium]
MRYLIETGVATALALLLQSQAQAASEIKALFIDQYDLDGNGEVDSVEFETARRQRFDLSDTNHDGSLDVEEYVLEWEDHVDPQLARDREEQVRQTDTRFRSLDTDEDGWISHEEFMATGEVSWQRYDVSGDGVIGTEEQDPQAGDVTRADGERNYDQALLDARRMLYLPSTHSKRGTIELYDADGDGAVTRAEFDAGREDTFARTDSNGDGRLDAQEYTFEFEDRLDAALAATRKGQVDQTYRRFKALDRDDDGRVTFAEYQYSGHRSFARHDTDADGVVTFAEPDPAPMTSATDQAVADSQ